MVGPRVVNVEAKTPFQAPMMKRAARALSIGVITPSEIPRSISDAAAS